MKLLLAALLVAAAFAGCASLPSPPSPECSATSLASDVDCAGLALTAAAPHVSARTVLDSLKAFSSAYPYRQGLSPTHQQAADDLAGRFTAAGLDVVRQDFTYRGTATVGGPAPEYPSQNVIGVKWGLDRTHFVVVGAHYDVTEGAVYGTYDDGSGTAMVFELAKAFADTTTVRTLLFCEFDQEERGLIGSQHFLAALNDTDAPLHGVVDGMVDLDMIGITWPHPAHLIVWENSLELKGKVANLTAEVGFPADHVEFRKPLGGSSDGAAFIDAKVPTVYFWSDWDQYILPDGSEAPNTPLPYVGPYPWWHKMDTYDTMVASAGDEATLQQGFQNTLDVVSPMVLTMTNPAFDYTLDPAAYES